MQKDNITVGFKEIGCFCADWWGRM
jgi:hypothetical protein